MTNLTIKELKAAREILEEMLEILREKEENGDDVDWETECIETAFNDWDYVVEIATSL